MNSSTIISNENKAYELTISAPINLMYSMFINPGMDKYNAGGGANTVSRLNLLDSIQVGHCVYQHRMI